MKAIKGILILLSLMTFSGQSFADNEIIEVDTVFCGTPAHPVGISISGYHALHYLPPKGNWLVVKERKYLLPKTGYYYTQTLPSRAIYEAPSHPIPAEDKAGCLRYLLAHMEWSSDMFASSPFETQADLTEWDLDEYKQYEHKQLRSIPVVLPTNTTVLAEMVNGCHGSGGLNSFGLTNGRLPVKAICGNNF